MTAGRLRLSFSLPPSTSREAMSFAVYHFDLAGKGGLGQVSQSGEHLAGLVAVVVNGLFAQDDHGRVVLCQPAL